jgi:glycolate oxidase FAD binding subunit
MRDVHPLPAESVRSSDEAAEHAARVREALEGLLGSDGVLDAEPRAWRVGSGRPSAVAAPASEEEVAGCLRLATERGWRVVPAGAGSWLWAGNPVEPVDVVLSVRRLDRIVQYEPADVTLTAGAGMTLGGLDRVVSEQGQWLPADPPGTDGGTLGGTLATASAGGLRAAFGAPRDLVLGLRLVTGDGRVLRLGGRVVKNVAGFDMVKLAVGSWGTLGVITEATLRLFPRPQRDVCLVCRGERLEELMAAGERVARARFVPASVQLLERAAGDHVGAPREAALVVRLVGLAERVDREAELLGALLAPHEPARVDTRGEEGPALLARLREVDDRCELSIRLVGPLGELSDMIAVARAVGRLRPGRDELVNTPHRIGVDAMRGSVTVGVPNVRVEPPWGEQWAARIRELRENVELRGGSLIAHATEAVSGRAGAWGRIGGAERLMAALKAQFDPGGVLSPGRIFQEAS